MEYTAYNFMNFLYQKQKRGSVKRAILGLALSVIFALAASVDGSDVLPPLDSWTTTTIGTANSSTAVPNGSPGYNLSLESDASGFSDTGDTITLLHPTPEAGAGNPDLMIRLFAPPTPNSGTASSDSETGLLVIAAPSDGSPFLFFGVNGDGTGIIKRRETQGGAIVTQNTPYEMGDTLRLVSGFDAVYLYRSEDDGLSWIPIGGFPISFEDFEPLAGVAVVNGTSFINQLSNFNAPLFFEITKDEDEGTYIGSWEFETSPVSWEEDHSISRPDLGGIPSVAFDLTPPVSGAYEVFLRWIPNSASSAATPVNVVHSSLLHRGFIINDPLVIDQTGGDSLWVSLGTYWLDRESLGQQLTILSTSPGPGLAPLPITIDSIRIVKGHVHEPAVWENLDNAITDYSGQLSGSSVRAIQLRDPYNGGPLDPGIEFDTEGVAHVTIGPATANAVRSLHGDGELQFTADGTREVQLSDAITNTVFTFPSISPGNNTLSFQRSGSTLRMLKNGTPVSTVTDAGSNPLHVDVSFPISWGPPGSLGAGIDNVRLLGGIQFGDADEDLLPDAWEFEIVMNESAPSKGIYSIIDVRSDDDFDGDGRTNAEELRDWSDPTDPADHWPFKNPLFETSGGLFDDVNPENFGTGLRRIRPGSGLDAAATERRSIAGNGALQFTVTGTETSLIMGLMQSVPLTPALEPDIWSLKFETDGNLIAQTGTSASANFETIGTYAADDRFMITRRSDTIEYWKNGVILATYPINPAQASSTLSAFAEIHNVSELPPLSGILVAGGTLPEDTDEDGLFDAYEAIIFNASSTDDIQSLEDVQPGDDFDGDMDSNLREQFQRSSATDPLDAKGARTFSWQDSEGVEEIEMYGTVGIRKHIPTYQWDSYAVGKERITFNDPRNGNPSKFAFTIGLRGDFLAGLSTDDNIRSQTNHYSDFAVAFSPDGTFAFAVGTGGGSRSIAEIVGENSYSVGDRFEILTVRRYEEVTPGDPSTNIEERYYIEVYRNGVFAGSRESSLLSTHEFGPLVAFRNPSIEPSLWELEMSGAHFDSDKDGLPDNFENQIVVHTEAQSRGIFSISDVRAADDYDGDGRSNLTEYLDGTNPTDPSDFRTFVPVNWIAMQFTDEVGDRGYPESNLRKISGGSQWAGGALSSQVISPAATGTKGAVRFFAEKLGDFQAGLVDQSKRSGWAELDFFLDFSSEGTLRVMRGSIEQNLITGVDDTYSPADRFMFDIRPATTTTSHLKILRNGIPIYQHTGPNLPTSSFGVRLTTEDQVPAITGAHISTLETEIPVELDKDNDGIPDSWELSRFVNLPESGFGSIEDVIGSEDSDNDGRTNYQEYLDWSNPLDPLDFKVWTPVKWTNFSRATEDGYVSAADESGERSNLRSTSSIENPGPSYASGKRSIETNGGFRFRVAEFVEARIGPSEVLGDEIEGPETQVGFDRLHLRINGTFEVWKQNATGRFYPALNNTATYSVGDEFSIERHGGVTKIYKNGEQVTTIPGNSTSRFRLHAFLNSSSTTPQISSVREYGAELVGDLDEDGLPDTWESQIINADPADSITSIFGVSAEGDYDGDGISNEIEFLDGTNPTDAMDRFRGVLWKDETLVEAQYPSDGLRYESGSVLSKIGETEQWNTSSAISEYSLTGDGTVQFRPSATQKKVRIDLFRTADPSKTALVSIVIGGDSSVPSDEIRVQSFAPATPSSQVQPFISDIISVRRIGNTLSVNRLDTTQNETIFSRSDPQFLGELSIRADLLSAGSGIQHVRALGFTDPLDRDGDGIPDADEQTFLDSNHEDPYENLSDIGLDSDIDGDGRTAGEDLRFGPGHFSKHPELKLGSNGRTAQTDLPTQLSNDPIRSLGGAFSVDPGGAATYAIPVPLPAGTSGMVPSLSVNYSSHAGNGVLGVGWSLGGLAVITRGGADFLRDGFRDPLDGDADDRFYFGPSRLVLVSGVYGADGSEYRTETDQFSKFILRKPTPSDSSWQVFDRSGRILSLGTTTDSNIRREVGNNLITVAWALQRVEDRSGNYYDVSYDLDLDGEHVREFLPSQIRYTGNLHAGLQPYTTVSFQYEERPNDSFEGYFAPAFSGKKAARTKRLEEISVSTNGEPNRRLAFTYQQSPGTGESRLTSVREYAHDGSTYAPTRFLWESVGTGWSRSTSWSATEISSSTFGDKGRQLLDLNGDSLPDLIGSHSVTIQSLGAASSDTITALNNGNGFTPSTEYALPAGVFLSSESPDTLTSNVSEFGGTGAMFVDLNGDGLPDLVSNGKFYKKEYYTVTESKVCLPQTKWAPSSWPKKRHNVARTYNFLRAISDGRGGFTWTPDSYNAKKSVQRPNGSWTEDYFPTNFLKPYSFPIGYDRLVQKETTKGVWLNTGNGWKLSPEYGTITDPQSPLYLLLGDSELSDLGVRFVDLDGDGLMDLIQAHKSDSNVQIRKVFRNTGNGWQDLSGGAWDLPTHLAKGDGSKSQGRQLIDMNGDGLVDLVSGLAIGGSYGSHTLESDIWLNTGSGWEHTDWKLPTWLADHTGELCGRALQDLNGDGLPDLIMSVDGYLIDRPFAGLDGIWLNTGNGWADGNHFRLPHPLVEIQGDAPNVGKSRPLGRIFSDVNGDGLVDFVSVGAATSRGVWLNTGTGWSAKDTRWSIPDGFTIDSTGDLAEKTSSFQLADIDGDGFPDFIDRTAVGQNTSGVWLNKASPERISRFLAPLADPVRVTYARMNDKSPRPETRKPIHEMGVHARYPHVDAQTPVALVSKVTRTDDKNRDQSTLYSYGGLRFDQRGRGAQGFRWMETIDLLRGFSSHTEFRQDYPFTGMVSYAESRLPDGRPLSRIRNFYAELPEKGGLPGGGGKIVFPYLRSSLSSSFTVDSAGAEHYHTGTVRTISDYDDWGNIRRSQSNFHTVSDPTVDATPLRSTTTVNQFGQENPAAWLIGKVTRSTTTLVSNEVDLVGPDSVTRSTTTVYHPQTGLPVLQTNNPESALSSQIQMQHDLFGNVRKTIKTTTGESRQITQEIFFDSTGRFPERTVNGLGHGVSMKHNPVHGFPLYSIDANGLRTDFDYNVWGALLRTRFADGTASVSVRKWLNQSRVPGAVFYSYKQTSGSTPSIGYYDRYGRVLLSESIGFAGSSSNYAEVQYDRFGRAYATSDPYIGNGHRKYWKTSRYDLLDRVVEVRGPDGRATSMFSRGFTATTVNPLGQPSTLVSDWFGRTIKTIDTGGGITRFRHDIDSNVARTTDVSGNVISATFNLLGLRTSMNDPHAGSTSTVYNGFGEIRSSLDNLGNESSFTYDVLGRVKTRITPEAATTYTYDTAAGKGLGKLHRIDLVATNGAPEWHHPHGSGYTEVHSYDEPYGRPIGVQFTVDGSTYSTAQTYDALGRPEISTDAGGFATRVKYNANGNAYEVVRNDNGTLLSRTEAMDSQGRLLSNLSGNGVKSYRSYNPLTGFLSTSGHSKSNASGTSFTPIQRFSYQYDDIGNLLSRADDRISGTDPVEIFGYDSHNRLESAGVAGLPSAAYSYTENGAGNLASNGSIADYRYDTPGLPHRLSSALDAGGVERDYSYDDRGRMTAETRSFAGGAATPWRGFSWTSFEMPRVVSHYQSPVLADADEGGFPEVRGLAQAFFTYDAHFSRRTQVVVKGGRIVKTLYLGAYEVVETREYESESDFEDMPLLEREKKHQFGGGVYRTTETSEDGGVTVAAVTETLFFHGDRLGSVSAVTDAAGEVVERMSFDSFGQRRTSSDWSPDASDGSTPATGKTTGSSTTRGYTGHEQLDHFGLVHMNGRIYDAELGRFLSPDPIIAMPGNSQSYNRYAYVLNNPHRYTDPSGYTPSSVMIGQPGFVPNETTIYGSHLMNGQETVNDGWRRNDAAWQQSSNGVINWSSHGQTHYNWSFLYFNPGAAAAMWKAEAANLRAAALKDVARFRAEQLKEIAKYNEGRRESLVIQPNWEVATSLKGAVNSPDDTAQSGTVVSSFEFWREESINGDSTGYKMYAGFRMFFAAMNFGNPDSEVRQAGVAFQEGVDNARVTLNSAPAPLRIVGKFGLAGGSSVSLLSASTGAFSLGEAVSSEGPAAVLSAAYYSSIELAKEDPEYAAASIFFIMRPGPNAGLTAGMRVNMPAWRKVSINMEEVSSGHMVGGWRLAPGHNKDIFPAEMTQKQVERAIRNAYRNGEVLQSQGDRVFVKGPFRSITIEMYVNRATGIIETAYPK